MSKNYVPRSSLLRQPWPASVDLSTLLKAGAVIAGTDTVDRDRSLRKWKWRFPNSETGMRIDGYMFVNKYE